MLDIQTGEIAPHMSATSARRLTDEIRDTLTVAYDKLVEAWHGRADLALGYESWDAYCGAEFTEARMLRPTPEQRREIVAVMRGEGMSTRAIGSALGVGNKTVHRDLDEATVSDDTEEQTGTEPVIGLDGRERPATQPRSEPEPDEDVVDAEILDESEPQPEPATPRPNRRAITDEFFDVSYDLSKVINRIGRLAADDRFPRNTEQIAAKHRSDLLRASDVLADVISQLPPEG